jgi:hypothetical protein
MLSHRSSSFCILTFSFILAVVFTVPATAQTVSVENGATVRVQNGTTWILESGTMDFGAVGATATLSEESRGRVYDGQLTATRALSSPSSADPAGLGIEISASADLGDVTVTRGHAIQTASNGNESIERYYDLSPSQNNSGLSATLTFSYNDAELNDHAESELEFFKSTDGGSSWLEEGVDSRDATANTATLSGIGSFSRWTLGSESSPLPVELAAFEGTVTESGVDLTWQTASETGNAGFEIQRKRPGASGNAAWTKIGFVDGAGSTSETKTYEFTDTDLPYAADTLSYRLRQVDTDGSANLSKTITVERSVDEVELLGTYPNPAQQRATVGYALPEEQKVSIRLYDVLGRQVRTVVSDTQEGRHQRTLDVGSLPSGVYFLRLRAGDETRTQKLTIAR